MLACVRVRPFGACVCRQQPSMQRMLLCGSVPEAARPCADGRCIVAGHRRGAPANGRVARAEASARPPCAAAAVRAADPRPVHVPLRPVLVRSSLRAAAGVLSPPFAGASVPVVRGRQGAGARVGDPSRSCMRLRACGWTRVCERDSADTPTQTYPTKPSRSVNLTSQGTDPEPPTDRRYAYY